MLRMEIALFLTLAFVAYIYFSAEKQYTQLHRTFSALLVTVLVHLVFDGVTVYTVNHLDTVPTLLNDIFHRIFIGTIEKQPLVLEHWDEKLWISLLETATVHKDNRITFLFKNGTAIDISAV